MRIKIKIKKHKRHVWRGTPKYWMAMGTLAAYSTTSARNIALAHPFAGHPEQAQTGVQSLTVRQFEISAGPLEIAVGAFEKTSGLHLRLVNEGFGTLRTQGVFGLYTDDEALRKLLSGTGLVHRLSGSEVSIELARISTSVDVTDNSSLIGVSMPKYTEPLLNTPQSISIVPKEVMEQQGVTTLRDALRNVAGISLAAGEGGAQGDNLNIRGFTARNDLFVDGMRDFGSYYRDPFNTEEINVLQGPSSMTFGRGSTGGVVNQVTKTPRLNHVLSGDLLLGTDATRRLALDLNQPLEKLGPGAAFRLNIVGHENEVAGRKVAENRRFGIAPSLALGLGTATRVTFGYVHQQADDQPDYGIPWLFNGAAPVARDAYYGFSDGNFLRTRDDIGTAKVEHDFNSHLTMRTQVRYANYLRDVQITEARLLGTPAPSTPLSQIMVTRGQIAVDSAETFFQDQTDVIATFKTGAAQHSLVAGVEGGRETSDPVRPAFTNVNTAPLLNPNPADKFTGISVPATNVNTTALSAGVYVLDTVKLFHDHVELTAGIRWDRFDASYKQSVAPAAAFNRVDEMPTWRAGAVYKPVQNGSIYFAYGTSFNPSAETLSLSAASANLPPEKNKNIEAGTKWDVLAGKLSLRGAVFQTEKENAREPDPANSLLNLLAGTQKVKGIQLEARGHITQKWELLSSYAYLDAKLTKSNFYPAAVGARLANVPADTFNFWTDYRFPWRIESGGGMNYVSSRTASSTVPIDPATGLVKQLPGYWVFNAMASRSINEHVSIQANVYNLANRYYYDQLHPAHIILGAGRSALIGLKFKF